MAGGVGPAGAAPWPELRGELDLFPGPAGLHGEPTWTLYDPQAQKFFRLGWLEVEIINRWRLGSPETIAAAVAAETTLSPDPARVDLMRAFVLNNNLSVAPTRTDVARLVRKKEAGKPSLFMTALKNYLFIRIPLVRPDAFLSRTKDDVRLFFSWWWWLFLAVVGLFSLYLIGRQWDLFRDSFASLLSLQGGLLVLVALGLSKAAHELGHAYAAKRLGLRVPSMGIALMCFAPVLWTDTTEAWKLANRGDRLRIGSSGVLAEIMLAVFAAVLWLLLPPSGLRTAAFVMASSTWVLTLAVNINPCMRYDGYYLLSDYWNIPGLQSRSFALAKWWMRERLFDLGLPAPEYFEPWDRFKLIVYAFATWIYRFFLFLGIALLVYHLFFKALGALLMLVELVFFIALPIAMEIVQWGKLRGHFTVNYRLLRTLFLFALLVFFLAYPWHGRVGGAALLLPERQHVFYAAQPGRIESFEVRNGERVEKGRVLARLRSPDLDARIQLAEQKLENHRLRLSGASLDMELRTEMAADWDELERLAEELAGLLAQRDELEVRAPIDGTVRDIPRWIGTGAWVANKEGLGLLVGGGGMVQAFVSEADWSRLGAGGRGLFYVSGPGWEPIELKILSVENQALTEILHPELASVNGGPLAAHKDASGRLVPEGAVYRVLCGVENSAAEGRFLAGRASLEAEPRSLAYLLWHNLLGLLIRESAW